MSNRRNKSGLHKLNPHGGQYPLEALCEEVPQLAQHIKQKPDGENTVDFSHPDAVLRLNQALLKKYYGVQHWMLPPNYLCPPIPGRADYICRIAELLAEESGEIPKGKSVKGLDIGTGANLVYPIIGSQLFGWKFVGSEIDKTAFETAKTLVDLNSNLKPYIKIRRQNKPQCIFENMIEKGEYYEFTMCNPPFHKSAAAAQQGTDRKRKNLNARSGQKSTNGLNFGGQSNELWCDGGESKFISNMIRESVLYQEQVGWFTSLVSKKETLPQLLAQLRKMSDVESRTIEMAQGNKVTRFIAWRFNNQ